MTITLREAQSAVALDDALLAMSTFHNGCDFRLRFVGDRIFVEPGCYLLSNLIQGKRRILYDWMIEGGKSSRELTDIHPEIIMELKSRKPCLCCGGFRFKTTDS